MANQNKLNVSFTKNQITADVFNRKYLFEGALPKSILVGGKEILSAPIRFIPKFKGVAEEFIEPNVVKMSIEDDKALFATQQIAGNIILNASVTIEDDGLVWIDALLSNFSAHNGIEPSIPKLTSLKLEIPLKKEFANLYHYWPNFEKWPNNPIPLQNSDYISKEGMSTPFKSSFWLGNEEGGLTFYMESAKNTQPADSEKMFNVSVKEDSVVLTIDLLESMPKAWAKKSSYWCDDWSDELSSVLFSFGLQATPVKKFERNKDFERAYHTSWITYKDMTESELNEFATKIYKLGAKWITLHEDWTVFQNYGLSQDEVQLDKFVTAMHKAGLKVMVYFGFECSTALPAYAHNGENYVLKNESGAVRGGWQRHPHQRAIMVCYKGDYSKVFLDRVAFVMENYGIDGIYTDGTFVVYRCANENHGCGYRDENGVLHGTFPLRAVREHVKKLNNYVHARGGIVEAHQSGCCIPMLLNFADSYWDGETISNVFKNANSNIMTGAIRSEFTGVNFGVPVQFLSASQSYKDEAGIMLLHGVPTKVYSTYDSNPDNVTNELSKLEEASEIWKTLDKFDIDNAKFTSYWQNTCPVKTNANGCFASVWEKDNGKALAIVMNLTDDEKEITVTYKNKAQTLKTHPFTPLFIEF